MPSSSRRRTASMNSSVQTSIVAKLPTRNKSRSVGRDNGAADEFEAVDEFARVFVALLGGLHWASLSRSFARPDSTDGRPRRRKFKDGHLVVR